MLLYFFISLLRRSIKSIEYQAKNKKQSFITKNFVIFVFKTCELNKVLFFCLLKKKKAKKKGFKSRLIVSLSETKAQLCEARDKRCAYLCFYVLKPKRSYAKQRIKDY